MCVYKGQALEARADPSKHWGWLASTRADDCLALALLGLSSARALNHPHSRRWVLTSAYFHRWAVFFTLIRTTGSTELFDTRTPHECYVQQHGPSGCGMHMFALLPGLLLDPLTAPNAQP